MRKLLNKFSFIACNSTIPSNKQRQEHNNLVAIQKTKLKGAHECSKNLQFVKPRTQMQTLTKMDKVVIKDYYDMTIMKENVDWIKLTSIVKFPL